jgi:predicted transcriptional regulator
VPRGEVIAFRCSPKRARILQHLADETDGTLSSVVRQIINEALPLPDEESQIARYRAIVEQSQTAA